MMKRVARLTNWTTTVSRRGVSKVREEADRPVLGELDVASRSFLTGVPEEMFNRHATIFRQTKNAMQDGYAQTQKWRIRFENQERWNNALTGWTSSRDPLGILNMEFQSTEEAISYCERMGYPFVIHPDNSDTEERVELHKNYADNFKYRPPQPDPNDIF